MKAKDLYNAMIIGSGGGVTPTGTLDITQNGEYDVTQYASADVDVPNTYSESDEGKVVSSGALVSQTSKNIGANGTVDTTTNNEVVVAVPNSYATGDEGKVVSNGALVSQTSRNITENGTVDTTLNNEVVVSVQPNLTTKNITQNGTYTASSDNADGYSSVTVNTPAPPLEPGEVNFFDYDGTLLYVMTIAEARALQALPALPDHSQDEVPLKNGEWNYTLAELQSLQIPLDVGASYDTNDEKNHFIIELPADKLTVGIIVGNGTVDWGDGSETETTYNTLKYHTYATSGRKHITLSSLGSGMWNYPLAIRTFGTGFSAASLNNDYYGYTNSIKKIYLYNGTTSAIREQFQYIEDVESILLPKSEHVFGSCFRNTRAKYVTIPRGTTSIQSIFSQGSVNRISIPSTLTNEYIYIETERVSAILNYAANTTVRFSGNESKTTTIYNCELYLQTTNAVTITGSYTNNNISKVKLVGPFKQDFFYYGKLLTDYYAPDSTDFIGSGTFNNCVSLERCVFGNIATIYTNAFRNCALAKIDLPATLTEIKSTAFYGCCMTSFICRATTPPTLADSLPTTIENIYVPDAAVEDYQAATNWSSASARIHPLSDIEP